MVMRFSIEFTSDLDIFHVDYLGITWPRFGRAISLTIEQSPQYKKWTTMDTSQYR